MGRSRMLLDQSFDHEGSFALCNLMNKRDIQIYGAVF